MGKTRGPYEPEYPEGTTVEIADREALDAFLRDWKLHNPLQPKQLKYAGRQAVVKSIGYYHGGDELYELKGIPGVWHEQCLKSVSQAK